MQHLGTVTLETPRLLLRRFAADDAADMYDNWASDDEVTRFLTWPTHTSLEVSQYVAAQWVEGYKDDKFYQWCIELKEIGKAIGSIAVVEIVEKINAAVIGYVIGKAWWHQGIMPEAFSAVIEFLFNKVGFNRIEARHDPHNPNSGKVMQKCGLKYEGTMMQASSNNTGICDSAVYGIINPNSNK
jgi:ribosomal-protein-alanine N-acetyltransferase